MKASETQSANLCANEERARTLVKDSGPRLVSHLDYMQHGMPSAQHAAPATQQAPAARAEPDVAASATADSALMSLAFMKTSELG